MDYELEFGFFIGKGGKNIARQDANAHIFGYSICNDIPARDAQAREMPGGLGPGKGQDFDTGNVIGPCIVTADEIDPYDCTMIARVNGTESPGSTRNWSKRSVAWLPRMMTTVSRYSSSTAPPSRSRRWNRCRASRSPSCGGQTAPRPTIRVVPTPPTVRWCLNRLPTNRFPHRRVSARQRMARPRRCQGRLRVDQCRTCARHFEQRSNDAQNLDGGLPHRPQG